ncbi:MAG TPA: hypothetical protein VGE28_09920 [Pseudomonas sp.]
MRKGRNEKALLMQGFFIVSWAGDGNQTRSVASQSVPNPLNTGFPRSSPARFVAIRPYDFDTFSTPAAKPAL